MSVPAPLPLPPARRVPASVVAVVVGALAALIWALHPLNTADLAAQGYRAHLFATHGFLLWDNAWYGGHYLPGYSLLFPPLGAALGLRVSGLLLVPIAAFLFAETLRAAGGRSHALAAGWFALTLGGELVIGRLTFLLGTTIALGAVLLLVRGRPRAAAGVGALATVASPVAGLFLLPVGAALVLRGRRGDGGLLIGGAGLPLLASAVLAPEGGVQPFSTLSFLAAAGLTSVFLLLTRARPGVVRTAAALYLLLVLACFVVPSPVGSNAVRLGVLFAGPVLLAMRPVRGSRPALAALVAIVAWQAFGPVTEAAKSLSTPAEPSVYAPLVRELDRRGVPGGGRIEIVPTATRWEVDRVPERFTLARGWESQLDRQRNPLFFGVAPLTAASYRAWLGANAVRFVVLPAMPLERWGAAEGQLVAGGLPYLHRVWRHGPWTLYAVADPAPLVSGRARAVRLTHQALAFTATATGSALARVRYTPRWTVVRGRACVRPAPGGMTQVDVAAPGRVVLAVRWGDGTPCR